ncbi:myosin light chain kinase, smooth muscle-like [Mytilus edulis]|uniref:myosin light chain kinase, smooth muscle-like n=1 Tax=Mytilus edulis TaxID=6550 RepID=UPI0039F130C0
MSKSTEFDYSSDFDKSTDTNSGKDETYVNEDLHDYNDDELRLFLEYDNTHTPYCFDSVEELTHISADHDNTHSISQYDRELPGQIYISQDETLIPSSSLRRGASVTDSPPGDRGYIREGGTKRPEKRRIVQPGGSELDGAHELEVYMHTDTKPDNKCNKGLISAGLPVIQIETDCYFFHTGETFLIPVNIHANPPVSSLRWEKNLNGEITTIDMSTHGIVGCIPNNPSLEIMSTKISDRGRYTCIALNAFGESRSNEVIAFIIEVNEREIATPEPSDQEVKTHDNETNLPTSKTMRAGPPELTTKKDQYSVTTGESVTLECIVNANPSVVAIRWTRNLNGAITEIDNKSTRFSGNKPSNPSLTILSTSITDQGCYTCFASNFLGEKSSRQIVLYISKDEEIENRQSPRMKSEGHKDREIDNRPTTQPEFKGDIIIVLINGEYVANK